MRNRCPHCGQAAISMARKLTLGPASTAACRACGQRVGVAFWPAMMSLVPAIVYVILVPRIHGIAALVISALLILLYTFGSYALLVPLRKRSITRIS
jgi:hypothetical protein